MAAVEKLHPRLSEIEGFVDVVAEGRVYGWAWDGENPEARIEIELRRDGVAVAALRADLPRPDLEAGGIGDGRHAFEAVLPPEAPEAGPLSVHARLPATGEWVKLAMRPAAASEPDEALRRIASMVEALTIAQQQIGTATHGALREIRAAQRRAEGIDVAALARAVDEIKTTQQALGRQTGGFDVFLLRFDTVLREMEAQVAAQGAGGPDRALRKATAVLAVAVAVALVAALL